MGDLIRGTRFLIRRNRVSPRHLAKLLGSWAWVITLRKELYSLLQECYIWLGDWVGDDWQSADVESSS